MIYFLVVNAAFLIFTFLILNGPKFVVIFVKMFMLALLAVNVFFFLQAIDYAVKVN